MRYLVSVKKSILRLHIAVKSYFLEPLHPLGHGRVGAKKAGNATRSERVDDIHLRLGRIDLHGETVIHVFQFHQSIGKRERSAADLGPRCIGLKLPTSGNGHLNEHRGNGPDDQQGKTSQKPTSVIVVAVTAHPTK